MILGKSRLFSGFHFPSQGNAEDSSSVSNPSENILSDGELDLTGDPTGEGWEGDRLQVVISSDLLLYVYPHVCVPTCPFIFGQGGILYGFFFKVGLELTTLRSRLELRSSVRC